MTMPCMASVVYTVGYIFGRPFVKRFALCYRSVVCVSVCPVLSVCDVGVLWPPPKKGAEHPIFGPCLLWQNGRMDQDGTWHGGGPWSMPHWVRRGPSFRERGIAAPASFRSMSIVATVAHLSYCWALVCFMAVLWNRTGHYIFVLWFLSSFFLFPFPQIDIIGAMVMSGG